MAGKVVVLDTQLKAVSLLQSFADIHPVVVLLNPTSPENLANIMQEKLPENVLQQTYQALKQTAKENDHIFTHIVDIDNSFETTVQHLTSVLASAMASDYWVNTFISLPVNTPEALKLERSDTITELKEKAAPQAESEVRECIIFRLFP